jgi:hypothetical protein
MDGERKQHADKHRICLEPWFPEGVGIGVLVKTVRTLLEKELLDNNGARTEK